MYSLSFTGSNSISRPPPDGPVSGRSTTGRSVKRNMQSVGSGMHWPLSYCCACAAGAMPSRNGMPARAATAIAATATMGSAGGTTHLARLWGRTCVPPPPIMLARRDNGGIKGIPVASKLATRACRGGAASEYGHRQGPRPAVHPAPGGMPEWPMAPRTPLSSPSMQTAAPRRDACGRADPAVV